MNIIAMILMFGVIVFVHEFGHFIFAKMNGIKVNEFAIGMGPVISTWRKKDTAYSLRALPLGGYCLMEGMAEESDDANGFNSKSVLARLSVLFAGPFFNFVLAFLLSIIICHYYVIDEPVLDSVSVGSAAEEAGFQEGDKIIKLDGQRIYNYREITLYSMVNDVDKPVDITYLRDGKEYNATITRRLDEESGNYYFGFMSRGRMATGIVEEMQYSVYEVRFQIKAVVYSLKMLVTGKAGKDSLMGPVGMGKVVNDVIETAKEETEDETAAVQFLVVILNLVNLAVLFSANLGVMNLLPIPALDGGRIVFVLIEAISGKAVPKDKELVVTAVSVVLLMLLMIFVFFNDLGNVLHG
ncbi:MAG: site-2 protease family protein [Eubacterium sp.]|nr:site-2 protease family protein [Eubacterium sp.]